MSISKEDLENIDKEAEPEAPIIERFGLDPHGLLIDSVEQVPVIRTATELKALGDALNKMVSNETTES